MSTVEREMLAYHEAGHVVVGWMLQHVDPLLKVKHVAIRDLLDSILFETTISKTCRIHNTSCIYFL